MSKRDIEYKLALVLAAAAVLLVVHVKSAAADFDFIRFSRFVNKYSDILIDYRKESLGILQRAKVERDTVMNEEYDTIKEDIDAEQDRLRELKIFVDFRRLVTEENLRAYNSMLYDELAYIERLRANDLMYERRKQKNRDEYRATLSELMTPDAIDLYSRLSRTIREMYEQMDIYQRELGKDLGSKKRIVYAN